MRGLKLSILTVVALLTVQPLKAQLSKVVVVDFEGAVVQSAEGKKATDKFNATAQAKQTEVEKKQKELDDQQKKLQAGGRTLSDSAKADIQRDIDRRTTELKRISEDAQKELQTLRDDLLRPIADRATRILQAMAVEQNYTLVVDLSNPESNVIWANPKNTITDELIKRIDAETPKETAAPPAAGARPTGAPPATAPRPTTTPAAPRTTPPASTPPAPNTPPKP